MNKELETEALLYDLSMLQTKLRLAARRAGDGYLAHLWCEVENNTTRAQQNLQRIEEVERNSKKEVEP